jgi:hypothetical protein
MGCSGLGRARKVTPEDGKIEAVAPAAAAR